MIKNINVIFYAVSVLHIRNLNILNKFIFKKKKIKITVLYEKNLNLINSNIISNDYEFYNIDNLDINLFLKNKEISYAIMCTSQSRVSPFLISYNCFKFDIPIICLQETNQALLHNKEFNNYVLPADYFLGISKFEIDHMKSLIRNLNTVVIGWPYNLDIFNKNLNNQIKKKKFLFNLNASNIINNFSLENIKKLSSLISKLIKKIGSENLYIRFHPAEDKYFIKTIKRKFNNELFLDNATNVINYKYCYDTLISTGFSQSIIDSIIDNKNIIIIKLEDKEYLIEKYNNIQIVHYNKIMDFDFISFNKKNIDHSEVIKDHIPLLDINSIKVLEDFFITQIKTTKNENKWFEYYLWNEFISIVNNNKKPTISIDIKSNTYYSEYINFFKFKNFDSIKFSAFINSFSNLIIKDLIVSIFIHKSLNQNKILNFNYNFLNFYPHSNNKNLFIYFIILFYNNKKLSYNKYNHKKLLTTYNMNYSLFYKIKLFIKNYLF